MWQKESETSHWYLWLEPASCWNLQVHFFGGEIKHYLLKSFPQWFNEAHAILKAYENLNLKYVEWVEYETSLQNHRSRYGEL